MNMMISLSINYIFHGNVSCDYMETVVVLYSFFHKRISVKSMVDIVGGGVEYCKSDCGIDSSLLVHIGIHEDIVFPS